MDQQRHGKAAAPMSPAIETQRLLLRVPDASDFDAWAAMMADAEVARFIGGLQHRAVAWRAFLSVVGAWQIQGYAMFSVIEKASGRWIGRLGPWFPEGWPGAEVGWSLVRDCWGRGYATEGATAAMDYAFNVLGWPEVIHAIAPENSNSAAVAARLGSVKLRQAELPPPVAGVLVDIWGQSREQWRARLAP
jgi:RimJ/RimL family protein N-acetyltransferase